MPQLHSYQRTAVAHLQANPRAALFLDMGLGKTASVLTALTPDHLPALVVAPPQVARETWHAEVAIWRPDLRIGRATGGPAQRAQTLADTSYDVVVISQDSVTDVLPGARAWRTLVLDELSGYKAVKAKRWKHVKRLRNGIPHVWGLTGTPAPNGLIQLWAQIYLLDDGQRLGRTQTIYRERHFTPGRQLPTGVITEWLLRPGHDKLIHAELEDICLAMSARDYLPDFPKTTFNPVEVPLPPGARRVYKTLKDELVADLAALGLGNLVHTAPTAAGLSNLLSQVNAGFIYQDAEDSAPGAQRVWEPLHTERTRAARRVVEETGSPVLMFYRYRPELEMLRKEFGRDLSTAHDRDVFSRWNAGEVPVLAAHPRSIGHGLNLQHGGHTSVWVSPTWDLELWDQANGRLPRQGQTHPVICHTLTSPGTVDTRLYAALRSKSSVQQALKDHLDSPI